MKKLALLFVLALATFLVSCSVQDQFLNAVKGKSVDIILDEAVESGVEIVSIAIFTFSATGEEIVATVSITADGVAVPVPEGAPSSIGTLTFVDAESATVATYAGTFAGDEVNLIVELNGDEVKMYDPESPEDARTGTLK